MQNKSVGIAYQRPHNLILRSIFEGIYPRLQEESCNFPYE